MDGLMGPRIRKQGDQWVVRDQYGYENCWCSTWESALENALWYVWYASTGIRR